MQTSFKYDSNSDSTVKKTIVSLFRSSWFSFDSVYTITVKMINYKTGQFNVNSIHSVNSVGVAKLIC